MTPLTRSALVSLLALGVPLTSMAAPQSDDLCVGQPCVVPRPPMSAREPPSEGRFVAVNVLLGGLTGGIQGWFRGHSIVRAFAKGAVGGGVTYYGKRMVAEDRPVLGRQVAATGASMVANAGAGRGIVDRLTFPLGPALLDVDATGSGEHGVRWNLATVVAIAYAVSHGEMSFDWRASLQTGSPVFQYVGGDPWQGRHMAGVVLLNQRYIDRWSTSDAHRRQVLSHEQIHVIQQDFTTIAMGESFDRLILGSLPGGLAVHRRLAIRSDMVLWWILPMVYEDDPTPPWETEAWHFGRYHPGSL